MPARPREALEHRSRRGLFVEMHRLRIEFGGKGKHFLPRDAARSIGAEMTGRKIFKGESHDGDGPKEARLWPLFAAISTAPLAWLVLCGRAPLGARPSPARDSIRTCQIRLPAFSAMQ